MILHDLTIKRANIDILKGTATISFEAPLSKEILDARPRLSWWASNSDEVTLHIINEGQLELIPETNYSAPVHTDEEA